MKFTRVESEVTIEQPPERVFDFATTPALWHSWHPATVEVRGVPQRPLRVGERALEVIAMAGRRDEAEWLVRACTPPQLWEITTATPHGAARVVYRLVPTVGGCRFHRTLEFRSQRWPWRALDSTLTRWLLIRQSARALENLKRVLEGAGRRAAAA